MSGSLLGVNKRKFSAVCLELELLVENLNLPLILFCTSGFNPTGNFSRLNFRISLSGLSSPLARSPVDWTPPSTPSWTIGSEGPRAAVDWRVGAERGDPLVHHYFPNLFSQMDSLKGVKGSPFSSQSFLSFFSLFLRTDFLIEDRVRLAFSN